MSIFKWRPLYACQHLPERDEKQRKLDAQVKLLKKRGVKIKKERQKEKVKFECPYIDPLTGCECKQTYAKIKYVGVLKHLRLCSLRPFQGNEKRLQDFLARKESFTENSTDIT